MRLDLALSKLVLGGGDAQMMTTIPTTGQLIDLRVGTAAAPDTNPNPLIKATRTMAFPTGAMKGAGGEQNASIYGIGVGVDPGAYQPVGVLGVGKQYSLQQSQAVSTVAVVAGGSGYTVGDTLEVQGGQSAYPVLLLVSTVSAGAVTAVTISDEGAYTVLPTNPVAVTGGTGSGATFNLTFSQIPAVDAIGVMGYARGMVDNPAIGVQGGYFAARRDTPSPSLTTVEMQTQNWSTPDSYLTTGAHKTHGLRMHAVGAQCGCALEIQRTIASKQWDVGLGFPQGTGGSPIATACIEVDCTSPYGLLVTSAGAAALTTAAIAVADGNNAGVVGNPVLIGQTAARSGSQPNAYLVVASSNSSTTDPMIWMGSPGGSNTHIVEFRNGVSRLLQFVAGATNAVLSGAVAGDFGVKLALDGFSYHLGGNGRIFTVKRAAGVDQLAFFAAAPAPKQTVTGAKGGNAALASLLAALAAYGAVTDSSTA